MFAWPAAEGPLASEALVFRQQAACANRLAVCPVPSLAATVFANSRNRQTGSWASGAKTDKQKCSCCILRQVQREKADIRRRRPRCSNVQRDKAGVRNAPLWPILLVTTDHWSGQS